MQVSVIVTELTTLHIEALNSETSYKNTISLCQLSCYQLNRYPVFYKSLLSITAAFITICFTGLLLRWAVLGYPPAEMLIITCGPLKAAIVSRAWL